MKEAVFLVVSIVMLGGCKFASEHNGQIGQETNETQNEAQKKDIVDRFYNIKDPDSLQLFYRELLEEDDNVGMMLYHKHIGLRQRKNASFSEAINSHLQGLNFAYELKDTVEIVQALNNLGTDFRRIGAQNEASDYHYRALHYAETYSGLDTPRGRKNRVISLNGIGNICLTLGYYDNAEKKFREALKDERKLKSTLG